jgi:hypothetical protein
MEAISVPSGSVVSCHLERPLDDDAWARFSALRPRHDVIALIRPPDPAYGEDESSWLDRARTLDRLGLHTHWTSPTHARPTGGDPAARVRQEAEWMRERGLEPRWFCGGGWYTDEAVRATVRELGLVDCTPRDGVPAAGVLPTTHSVGQLARAVLTPGLPAYVHAYFHDYDLLDRARRTALVVSLSILRLRRGSYGPQHGREPSGEVA